MGSTCQVQQFFLQINYEMKYFTAIRCLLLIKEGHFCQYLVKECAQVLVYSLEDKACVVR